MRDNHVDVPCGGSRQNAELCVAVGPQTAAAAGAVA